MASDTAFATNRQLSLLECVPLPTRFFKSVPADIFLMERDIASVPTKAKHRQVGPANGEDRIVSPEKTAGSPPAVVRQGKSLTSLLSPTRSSNLNVLSQKSSVWNFSNLRRAQEL